jgi:hypothetical protein
MNTSTTTSHASNSYEYFSGVRIARNQITSEKKALIVLQEAGYLMPGETVAIGGDLTVARTERDSWLFSQCGTQRAVADS